MRLLIIIFQILQLIQIKVYLVEIFIQQIMITQQIQQEKMKQVILLKLKNIQNKLKQTLKQFSIQAIHNLHRICSKQLFYYMNKCQLYFIQCKQIQYCLQECCKIIKMFVNASGYMKFGHKYRLYQYIVCTYEKQNSKKINLNQSDVQLNCQNYLKQIYALHQKNQPITFTQQNYLKQFEINQTLKSIAKDEIKVNNSQCVCCSRVFIKGARIFNQNLIFPNISCLTQKQSSDFNLEKYICSLCNFGGGVLIIGAERKNNIIQAVGIRFKDKSQAQAYVLEIYNIASFIEPPVQCYVQKVIVHTNFIQKHQIDKQFLRYCFRVSILTAGSGKKHYIQIKNKGYHSIFQTYQFNTNMRPFKVEPNQYPEQNMNYFYSLAMNFFYQNKNSSSLLHPKANSHKNIRCQKPSQDYSKIFIKYSENSQKSQQNFNLKYSSKPAYGQVLQLSDQPKLDKYNYTSLVVVGSKSKDKFVKQFSTHLKSKKILHGLQKPFVNSFKDGSKSIWLFTHNDYLITIKPILKQFDKSRIITLMPVNNTLQVDSQKFTLEKQQIFDKKFYSRYPDGYHFQELQTQSQNQIIKNPFFLTFHCFNQAIYAYLIFQSIHIKSFYVKPNTTYKKKINNDYVCSQQQER